MKEFQVSCILFILATAGFASCFAQSHIDQNDTQKVEILIRFVEQQVRESRPGDVRLSFGVPVNIDGDMLDDQQLRQSFASILEQMPMRDIQSTNPRPAILGTFWDFEIPELNFNFTPINCIVNCKFDLYASGHREVSGTFEFLKNINGWKIVRMDGLMTFLASELTLVKSRQVKLPIEKKTMMRKFKK